MPEISRFFGIVIYFYFKDHFPPHFHAVHENDEALISIETGNIIKGELPRSKEKLIAAWVEIHREELMFNFNESQKDSPSFKKINPLI